MNPIYTAHITSSVPQAADIRNEIRAAVEQGRAPRQLVVPRPGSPMGIPIQSPNMLAEAFRTATHNDTLGQTGSDTQPPAQAAAVPGSGLGTTGLIVGGVAVVAVLGMFWLIVR